MNDAAQKIGRDNISGGNMAKRAVLAAVGYLLTVTSAHPCEARVIPPHDRACASVTAESLTKVVRG
jgi:hypothetical protein